MLLNLFNIFDPYIYFYPLNFFNFFIIFNFSINIFWFKFNNYFSFMKLLSNLILFNNYFINKNFILLFYSLFMILFFINMMNLIPYILSFSNNFMFTLNLTLIFWNMNNMYFFFNNYMFFFNLIPKNTPFFMMWFINIIELNSYIFQILSLSLRLMINMIMGHIIMFLFNNYLLIFIYMFIEMLIIFIQTYIFFMLNLLNLNNLFYKK